MDDKLRLKRAVYFALFFMLVEIVGGIVANSLAIITDAAHMLSDVGGFVISLFALELADMEATNAYSYGFKQAEVLGALASIMIVWAITAVLLWEAVPRFFQPEQIKAPVMLTISVIGFLVNIGLMKALGHGHAHGEGGSEDHGHAHGGGEEVEGAAVQAAIAHVIGDLVQSLGVCLAALCIWVQPWDIGVAANGVSRWNYADPICTVLFGILVLYTTKSTLVRTLNTLMVKAPKHIDQDALTSRLEGVPHVDSIHDLHVWSLGSNEVLCTAHVLVSGRSNAMDALKASIAVAQEMGIGHSTFQVEILGEFDPSTESYGKLHPNPSTGQRPKLDDGGGHDRGDGTGHRAHGEGHGHGHGDRTGHGAHGEGHGHGHGQA